MSIPSLIFGKLLELIHFDMIQTYISFQQSVETVRILTVEKNTRQTRPTKILLNNRGCSRWSKRFIKNINVYFYMISPGF